MIPKGEPRKRHAFDLTLISFILPGGKQSGTPKFSSRASITINISNQETTQPLATTNSQGTKIWLAVEHQQNWHIVESCDGLSKCRACQSRRFSSGGNVVISKNFVIGVIPLLVQLAASGAALSQPRPAGGPTPSPPGAAAYFVDLKDGATLPTTATISFRPARHGSGAGRLRSPEFRPPSLIGRCRAAAARPANS